MKMKQQAFAAQFIIHFSLFCIQPQSKSRLNKGGAYKSPKHKKQYFL